MAQFLQKITLPLARISLFVIYFWFGLLKVLDLSPATPLVHELSLRTIPFIPFGTFMILFGLFEMLIGILFLIKGAERVAIWLMALHMITTFLPLLIVPHAVWVSWFVPTLEGQYIVKNLALLACAAVIGSTLELKGIKS